MLTPSLLMRLEPSGKRLELGYDGEYAWYQDFGNDDYDDHALEAGAYLPLGSRSGLDFVASYEGEHESRGTGLTQGFDLLFRRVDWRAGSIHQRAIACALYIWDHRHARRFRLRRRTQQRAYDNNLERTQQFDTDSTYRQATFSVRVRPNTALQLSLRSTDIAYPHPLASGERLDSSEQRYLVGVQWGAHGRTTGLGQNRTGRTKL